MLSLDKQIHAVTTAFDQVYTLQIFPTKPVKDAFDLAASYDSIVDARERFQLWSDNLGASRPQEDPRSLLHRLRNVPVVQRRIMDILQELINLLTKLCRSDEVPPEPVADYDGDDDDDELLAGLQQISTSSDMQSTWILRSICDAVTRLFKMSRLISKSKAKDRYTRAQKSRGPQFLAQLDIMRLREKHKGCLKQEWLVNRLGEANVGRRQYFKYCREHEERIFRGTSTARDDNAKTRKRKDGVTKSGSLSAPTELRSGGLTKASTVLPDLVEEVDDGFDDVSVSTRATSIRSEDAIDKLEYPALKSFASPGSYFECPFCNQTQRFNGQAGFKKHVQQDLRPFVCTFDHCGLLMFENKHAWADHEMKEHRRCWICPKQTCESRRFSNRERLAAHLQSLHWQSYTPEQIELILETSSRPLEDIGARECPFCDWETSLRSNNNHIPENVSITVPARKFMKHLADHLEQVALFALPRLIPHAESSILAANDQLNSTDSKLSTLGENPFDALPAMAVLAWTAVYGMRWRKQARKQTFEATRNGSYHDEDAPLFPDEHFQAIEPVATVAPDRLPLSLPRSDGPKWDLLALGIAPKGIPDDSSDPLAEPAVVRLPMPDPARSGSPERGSSSQAALESTREEADGKTYLESLSESEEGQANESANNASLRPTGSVSAGYPEKYESIESGSRNNSIDNSKRPEADTGARLATSNSSCHRQEDTYAQRLPRPPSPLSALPPGWFEATASNGSTYYYNRAGNVTWRRPIVHTTATAAQYLFAVEDSLAASPTLNKHMIHIDQGPSSLPPVLFNASPQDRSATSVRKPSVTLPPMSELAHLADLAEQQAQQAQRPKPDIFHWDSVRNQWSSR